MTAAANGSDVLLACESLDVIAGARLLVDALDLQVRSGEFLAVLGCNGSGKSLTLQTLAGLRAPAAGHIDLQARALRGLARRDVARSLAYLPQDREEGFASTALESVLVARHPHLKAWQREGQHDVALARAALAAFGLTTAEERLTNTLSGGEQRRVAMASLLAQQSRVYVLDEPSNHLDPQYQIDVLALFRARCAAGDAVIAALHDATLAARFADSVLLLWGDGRWRAGPAAELLTAGTLTELYGLPMVQLGDTTRRVFAAA